MNRVWLMGVITPDGAYIKIKNSLIPVMFFEGVEGCFVALKGQLKSYGILVNEYEYVDKDSYYNDAFVDGRVCNIVGKNILLEVDGTDYISCVCKDDSLRIGEYVRFAGKVQGNRLLVNLIERF